MPSALYTKFAEIGRVVYLESGPLKGKAAVIVEIIDHNRAIIDGPESITGVFRLVVNFKKIRLTDIVLDIPRGASTEQLTEAAKSQGLVEKFGSSAEGKRFQKVALVKGLSDFDRFKVRAFAAKRQALVRKEFDSLKASDKKSSPEDYVKLDRSRKSAQKATTLRFETKKGAFYRSGV